MTFDDIWKQLERKIGKPDMVIEFKPENLKALLRQVYDQGHAEGLKSAPAQTPGQSLFGSIFGGM